ncbi:MAG: GNAT family N-acetyltransferase [Bacillaceae bacterium]|nr:GNAT family N-acetyltransferase [Bacillaceae bacterium]
MIELQYFDRSDFKQLIHWIDSPQMLMQWGGPQFNYPLDERQLGQYIEHANQDHSDHYVYKVIHQVTGRVIGHISLGQVDRKNKSARIGKVLVGDKNLRGQGICRLMMEEILKMAFDKLDVHRVSLGVFDFNQSAITCYERVGFKKEGLLRDCRKIGDKYWSLWEMSILDFEWREKHN